MPGFFLTFFLQQSSPTVPNSRVPFCFETTLPKPVAPQQYGNDMGLTVRGPEFKFHLYSGVDLWTSLLALTLLSSLIIRSLIIKGGRLTKEFLWPHHVLSFWELTQDYSQRVLE